MSYTPAVDYVLLGYIQASAVSDSIQNLAFDIPNDMQTTEAAGSTDCLVDSLIIIRPARSNDASGGTASSYWPTTDTTLDKAYMGKVSTMTTWYNQSNPESFSYSDYIDITVGASLGSGSIDFTSYSHAQIWRA
jgi:hypothetical protein